MCHFFYFRYVDNNQVRLHRSILILQKYFVIFSNFFAISKTCSQDNLARSSIMILIERENALTHSFFKFFWRKQVLRFTNDLSIQS